LTPLFVTDSIYTVVVAVEMVDRFRRRLVDVKEHFTSPVFLYSAVVVLYVPSDTTLFPII